MIHPINIPEDLLEVNPRMPTIFEPRKKLQISYTSDGRRLNADGGAPLNAVSPNTEWKNFFLRSFVRRLACDRTVAAGEGCSGGMSNRCGAVAPQHIDIIDLQPNNQRASVASPLAAAATTPRAPDRPDNGGANSVEDERRDLLAFGRSARLPLTRHISARVRRETMKLLIAPCCVDSLTDSRVGGRFKEFARFDFSHSNFFADDSDEEADENDDSGDENASEEAEKVCRVDHARRKCSLKMIPNAVGSRLWTTSCPATPSGSASLTPATSAAPPQPAVGGGRERLARSHSTPPPSDLIFSVRAVSARRRHLEIAMGIRNSAPRALKLYVTIHVHEVEGDEIGRLVSVSHDAVPLVANQELDRIFCLDIYAALKPIFSDACKYPLVTLHGRVVDA